MLLQIKFGIEIAIDFSWKVCVAGVGYASSSDLLATLPQVLASAGKVRQAIDGLESLYFCTGNGDEKYFSVQAARKGVFKDYTGSLAQMNNNVNL